MAVTPRKLPTQARARARVEHILEIAEQLLASEGYENFTTNRVAKVAEVNIASVYQYFPNKHSLIYAVNQRMLEAVISTFDEFESGWNSRPWSSIFELLKSEHFSNEQHFNLVKALDQAAIHSEELQQLENEHSETIAAFFSRYFQHYGSSWSERDRLNAGRIFYRMGNLGHYDARYLSHEDFESMQRLVTMNLRQFLEQVLSAPSPTADQR